MKFFQVFILFLFTGLLFVGSSCDTKKEPLPTYQTQKEIQDFLEDYFLDIPETDQVFQNYTYQLLDGRSENLDSNRGKVLFLNFWATWCVPCKAEMPDMEKLHHELSRSDFRILAVSYGESAEKVGAFIKDYPYSFDVAIDSSTDFGTALGVIGLPTTFIIGQDGKILGKAVGPRRWMDDKFVHFMKQISHKQ